MQLYHLCGVRSSGHSRARRYRNEHNHIGDSYPEKLNTDNEDYVTHATLILNAKLDTLTSQRHEKSV
jgi:hypothetical protein